MEQVLVIDAIRTPLARRNGALSGIHPARLLAGVLAGVLRRTAVDGGAVQQVIAGCVSQVGEQSFNIGRTAWLTAGLPQTGAGPNVDAPRSAPQQAVHL